MALLARGDPGRSGAGGFIASIRSPPHVSCGHGGGLTPGLAFQDMALLRLPEPYSFELSTERFRAFGSDLANRWHGDALWRWLGGREVRIAAAHGGVDVEPFAAEARVALGAPFDLDSLYAFA